MWARILKKECPHLQGAVDRPQDAEPKEGAGKAKHDVDGCRGHKTGGKEVSRGRARPKDARDELGRSCTRSKRGEHGRLYFASECSCKAGGRTEGYAGKLITYVRLA